MATKSRLETVFTGDDRQFQKTAARIQSTGRKMGAMAGRLQGAFVAMGGAMLIRGMLEKFDRIGKLASRFDITAESLQKLGYVAEIGGADLETVAKAMKTLNTSAMYASRGMATYTREFEVLGLDAQEFFALNHEQRWLAIADAVQNATDRNAAMAAVTALMGRSGAEVFTILEQGAEVTKEMMDSVVAAKADTVQAIEDINDAMTKLKHTSASTFADLFVGLIDAIKEAGEYIGKFESLIETKIPWWARGSPALWFNPLTQFLHDPEFTTGEVLDAIESRDDEKWLEAEQRKKEADADILRKKIAEEKALEAQEEKEWDAISMRKGGNLQRSAKIAFAGEDPFKEVLEEIDKRQRGHKPPGITRVDKAREEKTLSGRFSEFMRVASVGSNRLRPERDPLLEAQRKQVKLHEMGLNIQKEMKKILSDLASNTSPN